MTKIKRRGLVVFLDCIKRRKNGLSDDGGVHTEKKSVTIMMMSMAYQKSVKNLIFRTK